MPSELLLVTVFLGALALILFIAAFLVRRRQSRALERRGGTAGDSPLDPLYQAMTPEARQFLTAVVQADTSVVILGPRRAGVLAFVRSLATLIRGRKPIRQLRRSDELAALVAHMPSCLLYLESPGLVSGIEKMRRLLAESWSTEKPAEIWRAIEAAVDLFVVVRAEDDAPARVETIAEPLPLRSEMRPDDYALAQVIFGWDEESQALAATGTRPTVLYRLRRSGILLPDHIFARRP